MKTPRVLFLSATPNQSEIAFRNLAKGGQVDFEVAYCTMPDPRLWKGDEQLNRAAFESLKPSGFPWSVLRNWSPRPALNRAIGLINPAVVKIIPRFDCVVVYGHYYISFWLAIITALIFRKPLILSNDAVSLGNEGTSKLKKALKRMVFRFLYGSVARKLLVPSTRGKAFFKSLGIDEQQIVLTPYVVDNEAIIERARHSNRDQLRKAWGVPSDGVAVVLCGKFIQRKGASDLIQAFAQSAGGNHYLILVGSGPLERDLKDEVEKLAIADRTRFLGLVSYDKLPGVYAACDIQVHPAHHEPFGLIVNEAMLCGLPVIVSDSVGAGTDLVTGHESGFIYETGKVLELKERLALLLNDKTLRERMAAKARQRMDTWGPAQNAAALIDAIQIAWQEKCARK